jgi:hypothetical protein
MSRSKRKPVWPIACCKRQSQKKWKEHETKSERQFLNKNLDTGMEKIYKKKFRDEWISPSDGNHWCKDNPKAYRK